jgi:hypothetical protein
MNAPHDPANIAVGCHYIANIGETGLLEEFMGMPDTPENRKKFLASIRPGAPEPSRRCCQRRSLSHFRRGGVFFPAFVSKSMGHVVFNQVQPPCLH